MLYARFKRSTSWASSSGAKSRRGTFPGQGDNKEVMIRPSYRILGHMMPSAEQGFLGVKVNRNHGVLVGSAEEV
eukprot:4944002-Amphidinium_carterae.2